MTKYVVVDLEMCRVSKQRRKNVKIAKEIIQIGAVLLDEEFEVKDKFMTFVKPEYGVIDEYINNLTGICNEDLIGAPDLKHALEEFIAWLPEEVVLVSWSNNDKLQIFFEIDKKGLKVEGIEKLSDEWFDCQKEFAIKLKNKKEYRLSEALCISNVEYEEGSHNGLVDAINTAKLLKKVKTEAELKLCEYYFCDEDGDISFGFSLGSLLGGTVS